VLLSPVFLANSDLGKLHEKWEVIAAPVRSWELLLDHATPELLGVLDHNPPSSRDGLTFSHLKAQDRKWIRPSILLLGLTRILFIGGH